ncbi:MAG: hypothetical protein HKN06_04520 [Gammaproteobacteria bacterium]|nr:hypothetical protein [Gammaproteobacteria bacterium]
MKKKTAVFLGLAVLAVGAVALVYNHFMDRGRLTTTPEYTDLARTVAGNELISTFDPAATLHFAPEYRYLGGQKFILYGVADTEQYLFVETMPDDRLQSVYWVQFEAYLPDKPYKYDYDDSPLRVQLGDYEFHTDTAPVQVDPNRKRRRGTDGAMFRQLLGSNGYTLPDNFSYSRMVYLTDESRQKELMIIFIDDLAPLGLTGSELKPDGARAQRWPEIEQRHLDKVRRTLEVR